MGSLSLSEKRRAHDGSLIRRGQTQERRAYGSGRCQGDEFKTLKHGTIVPTFHDYVLVNYVKRHFRNSFAVPACDDALYKLITKANGYRQYEQGVFR